MLETTKRMLAVGAAAVILSTAFPVLGAQTVFGAQAVAGVEPALSAEVQYIEDEWGRIKFDMKQGSGQQLRQMDELGKQADALAERYPDQPAALTWAGIVLSERASLIIESKPVTGGIKALGLAKQAKSVLERSYEIDPTALGAAAATTLGTLYYRVPAFPVGFGNMEKARALLEEAVRIAPDSLDTIYYYADFLISNNQLPQARAALQRALAIPQDTSRPNWDRKRRLVIENLLEKIRNKS